MPFFSVVIPTYNQCNFLNAAIKSVLKQTFKDFEIIVIDNFSNDNTKKVIKSFASKKIIYKQFKNNGVIGASRNLGIKLSKGSWVAFLDSDDTWNKHKLKVIYKEIHKNKKFFVFCSNEIIINTENNEKKIWHYGPYKKNFYNFLVSNGNCLSTSASVVNKKILELKKIKFSEKKNLVTAEDYDFFLKIAFHGYKFKFLKNILGEHLMHPKSMSNNFQLHRNSVKLVITKHTNLIYKKNIFKQFFLLRNKFIIYLGDLKYYLDIKKDYFRSFYISFFLILFYPDKTLKFFLKKIKKY